MTGCIPQRGLCMGMCSRLELHGLLQYFLLSGPVVSQVSLSSVTHPVYSHYAFPITL